MDPRMTKSATLEAQPDFSLVLGGPLYQLFRRAHLSGDALELLRRRIVIIVCVAWVPLLLLSVFSGTALGDRVAIPFLYDIEAHVRFLIALPILIAAELVVHLRIRPVVRQFVERRIIIPEEIGKFQAAIESTMRLRNSMIGEVVLVVLIYTAGIWVWRNQIALGGASWYASPAGTQMNLTAAGYWYVFASVPIFQFILLRWYLRLFLWFWFLFRVSRLNLHLIPTHPDRAGGLGFLGRSSYAFGPILLAQGAMLAGLIASQIFHAGQELMAFKVQVAGFVIFFIIVVFSPLTVFTGHLAGAKRQALGNFGRLASGYARKFEDKWFQGDASASDELLGSADIQSLADLGNSYSVVTEMRLVPFGWRDVTRLIAVIIAPLLPLTLTIFSLDELVSQLVKVLF
jgi:hypothetical protein